MNLARLGEESVERFGEYTALHFEGRDLTNVEQQRTAARVARALARMGVSPGDRVVVLLPNCPEVLAAYTGILKAGAVSAQARFNEGRALAERRDWPAAERRYRDAIELDPALPEPWNGLGYALRQQRRWDESVKAYLEALRLRPNYPQALEYLGQAYVEMGRLDDARAVHARLQPLDPREADELAQAIARAARL